MKARIPPLTAIRVFYVASQQLNFARAAEALDVSQSAVSKQISILEDYIGTQLFERNASGVSLTFEGRELKQTVAPAFTVLEKGFERYSRASQYTSTVRIATLPSFAAQCLVPRLDALYDAFPSDRFEVLTSDRVADLSRESIDLSIRFGAGNWADVESTPLSAPFLIPICSRETWAQHSGDEIAVLKNERRLQSFLTDEWLLYEKSNAFDAPHAQHKILLEHFLVSMAAVGSGQGIALLPEILVKPNLESGDLVQFGAPLEWHETFYLCHLPNAQKISKIKLLSDWLIAELVA